MQQRGPVRLMTCNRIHIYALHAQAATVTQRGTCQYAQLANWSHKGSYSYPILAATKANAIPLRPQGTTVTTYLIHVLHCVPRRGAGASPLITILWHWCLDSCWRYGWPKGHGAHSARLAPLPRRHLHPDQRLPAPLPSLEGPSLPWHWDAVCPAGYRNVSVPPAARS